MKKTVLLSVLIVMMFACKKATKKTTKALTAQEQQKQQAEAPRFTLEESLTYLASDQLSGRDTGTNGIELAAQHIETVFESHSVKPYFETYRDSFLVKNIEAYNVVGVIKGTQPELKPIVIGAHYDHIGHIKPVEGDSIANGANDNASGTVAVLELAKHFAKQSPKRDVVFALFSAEERGLLGSKHLAERFKSDGITPYFVFNIEMIGVPMQGKTFKSYITGFETSNMAERFNTISNDSLVGFLPQAQKMGLFKRSDNYPFYSILNVPAQTVCTFDFTNFDYYHHVDDEFHEMDVKHLESLVNAYKPVLTSLSNEVTTTITLN